MRASFGRDYETLVIKECKTLLLNFSKLKTQIRLPRTCESLW